MSAAAAPLLLGGPPGWLAFGALTLLTLGGAAVLSMSGEGADDPDSGAEERLGSGAATSPCSDCGPDDDDEEQDAKDAKRMSTSELNRAARNNGYRDGHDLKRDHGLDSKSDIFVDRRGEMYSGPRQGTGTPQRLNMNKDGFVGY